MDINSARKLPIGQAAVAFHALEQLIEKGAVKLDQGKFEARVLPELWTAWATADDVMLLNNITRNIFIYLEYQAGKRGDNRLISDVYFYDSERGYYLGKYNRQSGLQLPG